MPLPENESPDDPLRAHGITIRDSAEPLSPDQLEGIERSVKLRLPAEYRSFLMRSNGGVPEPRLFHYIAMCEALEQQGERPPTDFLPAWPHEEYPGWPDARRVARRMRRKVDPDLFAWIEECRPEALLEEFGYSVTIAEPDSWKAIAG
jgi:hypothetical protein